MRLPNGDHAEIDRRTVTEYLLSDTHPVGRHKRRWFESAGFSAERPEQLVGALRGIAARGTVAGRVVSRHGVRYIVDEAIESPGGASLVLRTVWVLASPDDVPHFVTAYPRP